MKSPLYRDALRTGWNLAWRHKLLWVYGFFAAFLGQMGIFELIIHMGQESHGVSPYIDGYWDALQSSVPPLPGMVLNLQTGVVLIWSFVIMAGIAIMLAFVSVVSQGALIRSAAEFDKKKKLPDSTKAWHAGVTHFWKLFFLQVLKNVFFFGILLSVGVSSFNAVHGGTMNDGLLFLLLFFLAAIVGIVIAFVTLYAATYVVVEEESFWMALEKGWQLFLDHWLVSLEVAAIFAVINILVLAVGSYGFLLFFSPVALLGALGMATGNALFIWVGIAFGTFLSLLFIAFLGTVFTIFSTTTWTYLFMEMHHVGVKSRIMHWLGR